MKEVGLLIDLYLSPTEEESVVRHAASDFFIPLIRLLKNSKNICASINVPLSTLELLDKFGFQSLISEIKQLRDDEKIELIGSAAYNPLLTELPAGLAEKEIILNEYALGYYFGAKQGFEGEPSILIKDIDGFGPTLGVVNSSVLYLLQQLNYKWVYVDGLCLPEDESKSDQTVFNYGESDLVLVRCDEKINNLINRFSQENLPEIEELIISKKSSSDSSLFMRIGNDLEVNADSDVKKDEKYFKKKMSFVEMLMDILEKEKLTVNCVRDVVKNSKKGFIDEKTEKVVLRENLEARGVILLTQVLYSEKKGELSNLFRSIDTELVEALSKVNDAYEEGDYQTLCLWNEPRLGNVTDNTLHNIVCLDVSFSRFLCYEKYVYSYLFFNEQDNTNYVSDVLCKYMSLLNDIVKYRSDELFTQKIKLFENKLQDLIKI